MSISCKSSFYQMKIFSFFLGVLATYLFSASCYVNALNIKNNTIRVCSDAGFLPFEMKNSAGQWEGYDIDMMKEFAKSLNAKLEMVQINFDGIIPALLSGKCDMIASGMTFTPNREKVVTFSHTTFQNGLSIAIRSTEKEKYKSLSDLDKNGIKIAVKTGYTSDLYLTQNLKNAQVLRFDGDSDLYLAVLQGRVNAFVSDSTYVHLITKEYQNKFFVIPTNITSEKFAVATRKQDKELNEAFNQFLDKWKTSFNYKQTYVKYFKI